MFTHIYFQIMFTVNTFSFFYCAKKIGMKNVQKQKTM